MKTIIKGIMVKYLLAVLLVGALCVLIACGGEKDSETDDQPDINETETEVGDETDAEDDETELTLPRDEF